MLAKLTVTDSSGNLANFIATVSSLVYFTPRARVLGVAIVIGCVVVVIILSTRLVSITNQSNLAKKWLQYASN